VRLQGVAGAIWAIRIRLCDPRPWKDFKVSQIDSGTLLIYPVSL